MTRPYAPRAELRDVTLRDGGGPLADAIVDVTSSSMPAPSAPTAAV